MQRVDKMSVLRDNQAVCQKKKWQEMRGDVILRLKCENEHVIVGKVTGTFS